MTAEGIFKFDGARIDYVPAADVDAGEVVPLTNRCGIATRPILADEMGALAIEGVFSLPKAAGTMDPFEEVYWDDGAGNVTTSSGGNTFLGRVIPEDDGTGYASDAETVLVKINY